MINEGTIPAVFESATVVFSDNTDQALLDDMEINYEFYGIYDGNGNHVDSGNLGSFPLSQFEEKLNDLLSGVRLEPGHNLVLGDLIYDHYDLELSEDTTNDTENKHVGFTVTINFKQFNK